ncbi:MAG TPA: hypothetical protein VGR02_04985 [Thermoanaerobaculia bacterium]|jgi:hypothetical protein|nr:hypothetical protein [Thermoanaerobaculia bacterium]
MKKSFAMLFCLALLTASAFGQELNPGVGKHKSKDKDHDGNGVSNFARPGGSGNLVDHGGEVLTNAKVVFIFWGWASTTTDNYVKEVISFRDDPNAMMKHIGMLSQYRSTGSTSLKGTQPDVYDAVPPPATKVTDAMVQAKARLSCTALAGGCKTDTIYEVFIPSGYFSDDGTGAQSCGGTNLQYCAYHGNGDGVNLSASIKYSIQPYPGCSGCHGKAAWTAIQDQEHFLVHETREAMTDARLNAWWDRAGYEADDKCAWGGATLDFLFDETVGTHLYGYQMEYSNATKSCVK